MFRQPIRPSYRALADLNVGVAGLKLLADAFVAALRFARNAMEPRFIEQRIIACEAMTSIG